MFYSQFILAKKGPLGTIWIAAHLERKLRKNQVADTDIGVSVDSILSPDVPIALRLSSHLLLGVVRIYSRKVNYLFHDCSEALLKVKQAFRSTAVDLPPEESTAPYHSITLPETFDLDDFELPDSDDFQGNFVDHHISTREQITLQDSMDTVVYSTSQFGLDERFGDGDTSQGFDLDEELFLDKLTASEHTVLLFDSDNVDLQASGQPMTPFTGMDIDDDTDLMTDEGKMAKVVPTGSKVEIDLNAQDVKIVDDSASLWGSPNRGFNFDGHDLPTKLVETSSMDPTAEATNWGPDTPRFMEAVSPINNYTNEGIGHARVNETSLSNSQEVTMHEVTNNLQLDLEHCDPKLVPQNILENLPSKVQFEVTNEAGDCSLLNNEISELDISKMPQDTQVKQQGGSPAVVDANSISVDVGRPIFSPTSVLTEQLKPTSPASTVLDDASALPVIMERTGKNGGTTNEDPTFSNVDLVHTEDVPVPGTMDISAASALVETWDKPVLSCVGVSAFPGTMDIAAASTSVETCDKPILSRGGVSANCKPSNDSWTISNGTSGCIPYMEHSGSEAPSKVGPPGDMPVSMPYVTSGCIPHKEYSGSEAPLKVGQPGDMPVSMPYVTSGFIPRKEYSGSEAPLKVAPPGDMPVSMPYVTSGCIPHKEYSGSEAPLKVGPPGDSPVSMPNVPHPLLGSLGAVEFNKDESRVCSEREVTKVLHVVGIDKESFGHGGVLRPCNSLSEQRDTIIPAKKDSLLNAPDLSPMAVYNSLSRQPDTVIPVQGGFQLNTRDMSPMRAEPRSLAISGQMPVRTAGFSTVVQGEAFQPTGIWNTVPAFYPSNGLGTPVNNFDTVISRDSQSGNVHYPANCEVAVPDLERLRSTSASISFPPSDLLRQSTSEKNVFAKGVVSKDSQSGHSNYPASYESSLPEPERMLSAPAEIPFAPSNFLMHSTSEKQVFTMSEGSGSGFQTLSGKKRQLMESELVLRDSPAKRSGTQSKATVGFVPNDYDVLSSILASRPSVLKLKPTPSQSDIASKKRPRVAPRTTVAKRKVLLDDTMVLHGDTIRQQLTSTEDIRRIRKKAPCTRPEIWMIQKLLLEDEVFSETLFTGMSSDLVGLHNRTYGVNIKVPQMDVDHMLPEVQDVVMLSNSGHLMSEANTEGTENGSNVNESMESSKQIENRLSEQHQINSFECDGQEQSRCVAEISPFHFQKGELDITATMETDNGSGAADMLNTASTVVGKFAFGTRTISEDRCNETVGSEIELSVNKTNGIEKILHNDGNFDIHSVAEKDGVISDRSKEREDAAISASEVNREGPPLTEGVPEEQNGSLNKSNGAKIVFQNDGNLDLQSVEKDAFIIERSNGREDDAIYASEVNRKSTLLADGVPVEKDGSVQDVIESSSVGVVPQFTTQDPQDNVSVGCLPPTNIMLDSCSTEKNADVVPDATTPLENRESPFPNILVTSEGLSDPTGVTNDYVEEGTWSEPGHVGNENAGESVRDEAGNLTSSLMSIEDPQRDFSDALEFDTNTETVPYDEGKKPGSQNTDLERTVVTENLSNRVANPEGTVNAETTSLDNASVDTSFDLENTFDEDDTEFLNFDDDEELEEEDNPMPNTEEAKILDTSGWSSRTRGVARYLQTQFDAETGHGRKVLCMDNLLSGKTRKEASRMFFETLVLKTRDYVHVEQENPFDVINIKPRGKLVKSTF